MGKRKNSKMNDKKVILLTDYYLPNNNANGLCMHRIGIEMKKMGYEVHVVAYHEKNLPKEEYIEGIYVHRVRPLFFYYIRDYYYKNPNKIRAKFFWEVALWVRRVKKIIFMPWYPLVSPMTVWRYYKKAEQVAKKYQVTNFVAGYNPFESAVASVWLKKQKNNSVVVYFMDTFTMTKNAKQSKLIYQRGRAWEKRIYAVVDGLVNFTDYRVHFEQQEYAPYQNKMMFAGVPVNFDELMTLKQSRDYFRKDELNLLYTGGLKMGDRDPIYLLDLLKECKNVHYQMHFFSRGDAEEYLYKKQKENERIVPHGQVTYEELNHARASADIMVNIGSRKEIILPSRLLEYIGTGKPILHIASRSDDPCIPYLEKYPDGLILFENEPLSINVQKVICFLNQKRTSTISKEKLEKIYLENSSVYIAQLIQKVFNE